MKTVIEMAREAGFNLEQGFLLRITGIDEDLERFAELVRADERARMAEQHENAILDERDACATLMFDIGASVAEAIRNRNRSST